ncbi:MAG: enoyl-CoA hydratase/isomerase family protein, partial [Deltaproteobacteria bacterium]|nr:enoyl-CoA hydratase/isomerase family protein [Deltaproteobacteria bacterium]
MDVIFEKEGPIATITINREKALNALNGSVMETLAEIFRDLEEDGEVMVVIMTGAGEKAFVAGADVKEIKDAGQERPALIKRGQEVLTMIRNSSKVVIAAVNGYALGGGCELAMSCDIRFASENARFALPEAKLGLMPGYGGTQMLSRIVGTSRAKYIMFSGDMLSANEAFQFGLAEKVCSKETLMEEVKAFAHKVTKNGPMAVRGIKMAIDGGIERTLNNALDFE